jgi:hypothetical protein
LLDLSYGYAILSLGTLGRRVGELRLAKGPSFSARMNAPGFHVVYLIHRWPGRCDDNATTWQSGPTLAVARKEECLRTREECIDTPRQGKSSAGPRARTHQALLWPAVA